jgi:hypothetical protein
MSLLTTHQFIKVIDRPQYNPYTSECREAAQNLDRAIQDEKTAAIMAAWPPMEHGATTAHFTAESIARVNEYSNFMAANRRQIQQEKTQ